ncbi:hypothetical protein DdX_10240 [Ditylenchus destructor]|uniref:Secreted protein n=1 Tax=Ditylenchus destructor TaxID=166010 RepID=A0AAD4N0G8_9BILA|nr:hypothetical protein DdX_10240 [Ditylenchus destructor]
MAIMHYLLVLIVLGLAIPALGRASHSSSAMHNDKSVEISVKTDIHGQTVIHCDEGRTLQNRECQWALKKVAGVVARGSNPAAHGR